MIKWMKCVLVAALLALLAIPAEALTVTMVTARFSCVAGETITAGQAVTMKAADGYCYKADADDAALRPAVGIAGATTSTGNRLGVVTSGIVAGNSSLTKAGAMYLSTTAGGVTQTQPSAYSQTIGRAISATEFQVQIQPPQSLKVLPVAVENLAAAADIGVGTDWKQARAIYQAPRAMTIHDVLIYGRDTLSVYAYGNVVRVFNDGATVAEKSYNTATVWPAAFTATSIGTIANANVAAGKSLFFEIVNGVLCDPPAFDLLIEYFTGD